MQRLTFTKEQVERYVRWLMGGYPDETAHGAWNILICRQDDPCLLEKFIDDLVPYLEKEPPILPLVEASDNDYRLTKSLNWIATALVFMATRKPSLLRGHRNFFRSVVHDGLFNSRLGGVINEMTKILHLLDSYDAEQKRQ